MNKLNENILRILKLMEVELSNEELDEETEVNEEGEAATTTDTTTDTTTSTSSTGYPTVKKHSDTYQTKRGKANPIDMKSKWESGRVMGKTYMGPNAKWESGRTMGSTGP
jgi:hypothetical protein